MIGHKLIVEVVAAKALMPKDGQGSTNAYCVLDYDGQREKTRVKLKDLDPTWNEKFEFDISDIGMPGDLEINIQNEINSGTRRRISFLGRVAIPINTVPSNPEPVRWYPLQKRGLFSNIKGDLGVRIWWQPEDHSLEPKYEGGRGFRIDQMEGGGGRAKQEAGAERQPEAPRPNLKTVQQTDFTVNETDPVLGRVVDYRQHYDLVEQMPYLFVHVVRARDLLGGDANGLSNLYVRITVGPMKAVSRMIKRDLNPEWNQVFVIGRDKIQGGALELSVWDGDKLSQNDFLGGFSFDLHEIPSRKPPKTPLAPQWYKLEAKTGKGDVRGEIMVSIWWGTQADEAFPYALQSDTGGLAEHRLMVYSSPRLWYCRVNVIEAQDLATFDKHIPDPYVRVHVDPYQILHTGPALVRSGNPFWNEDLMFVVAEPFDDVMHVIVEDRSGPKDGILGHARVSLSNIEHRIDGRSVAPRWYALEREGGMGGTFLGRIQLRLCFDGGYHVLDEPPNSISDTRPTARELWRPPLGVLELGINRANSLLPMKITKDNRGCTDAYCVAKYGPKWIQTRTICRSFSPRWNEQYSWEVHDPCTVLTVSVFDESHTFRKDLPLGKVRIRLSTLENDCVYTNAYPLLVVTPQGVKKMGELELAVRFSCASQVNLMHAYLQPQLPRMHYVYPLHPEQLLILRVAAMNIVALKLMTAEPPLRQEIVQFMLDDDTVRWSMRKSKAHKLRIMRVLNGVLAVMNWFVDICNWRSPVTTVLAHILVLILGWYPELFLPTVFLFMFLIGSWSYRFRSWTPPVMHAEFFQGEYLICSDHESLDELEEEFNVIPASRAPEALRHRYERLRGIAGQIQVAAGDLVSMAEKLHSLFSWQDPRASAVFVTFCLVSAIVLYVTPFQVVAVLVGVYTMRHPWFRDPLPPVTLNFFKRLPTQEDRYPI